MSVEATGLIAAISLGLFQLLLAAQAVTSQRGIKWNLSSREQSTPAIQGLAGRLERASRNFNETFPFFAALALLSIVTKTSSSLTELGVVTYVGARIVYLGVYALGIPVVRSLVWLVSLAGLVLIGYAILSA